MLHARGDDVDIPGMEIDLLQMTASPPSRRQHENHEEGRDERPARQRGPLLPWDANDTQRQAAGAELVQRENVGRGG
ncbi:hypothetical protein [Polyangium sp. 15x6]|uniref:hypothetical protein n=1 Tax=Polyangium sp. 15x6 TaxID=3042687 RepID=UPI002499FDDE|nr:hypothetical protein [Polyangium sp. 15x6]MDI3291537.1 hypothetical protein [Polyangium sp. 15x6]